MSLSSLQTVSEARPVAVLHPVKRTPLFLGEGDSKVASVLHLYGKDSEAYGEVEHTNRSKVFDNLTEGAKFAPAEQDQMSTELLVACTAGWEGIPQGWIDGTLDETPAPFSKANATKLYENKGVKFVRELADKAIADRARFLRAS